MTAISGININCGDGNNTITINGGNATVVVGEGDNGVCITGDNSSVTAGNGDNDVVFNSDNFVGKFGDGNNTVTTLDVANAQGRFLEYKDKVKTSETTTSEKTLTSSTNTGASLFSSLSAAEQAIAQNLDFSTTVDGNNLRYVIALAPDGQYHVYEKTSNTARYKSVVQVQNGSNYLTPAQINSSGSSTTFTNTYDVTTTTTSTILGVYNPNLSFGNGNNTVNMTIRDDNATVNAGDGHNGITINVGGYSTTSTTTTQTTETETKTTPIGTASGQFGSPLIVDFNQDGKVSAEAGKGVDINNDGKADGAAVNGDKMLAMKDLNGNGVIDGAEVFGDKTVDPFTGKAIGAANGFDALKSVAESAEKATGIKCYTNGEVDLEALNKALGSVGQSLGFISDDNVTELEALSKVKSINVDSYKTQNDTGDVQHRQLGSATFKDGTSASVHDVWFAYNNSNVKSTLAQRYLAAFKK